MIEKTDIIGKTFGYLKVIRKNFVKNGKTYYLCQCECGNMIDVRRDSLIRGATKSCGCRTKELCMKSKNKVLENIYDMESESYGIGYTRNGEKFLFDKEDYEKIKRYSWYINDRGYVKSSYPKDITLHRLVMGVTNPVEFVDHIHHVKTDCRKNELRIVTCSQNQMNRTIGKNNMSGFTGVSWHKKCNKWIAQIGVGGCLLYLGMFKNFDDAIKARKNAEQEYFGEYNYSS